MNNLHFQDYLFNINNSDKDDKDNKHDEDINKFKNTIIYGLESVGKYSNAINLIYKYSKSKLKYEKKIIIINNKNNYIIKISDIHYEVDLQLLGCNSKSIWQEIYTNIIDCIQFNKEKNGIILLKNFQDISNDLLEIIYTYMQTNFNSNLIIKYIILTTSFSFIPENIINSFNCIKITNNKSRNIDTNIELLNYINRNNKIIEVLENVIIQKKNFDFIKLREILYDTTIYDINISEIIEKLLDSLIKKNYIDLIKFNKIINYYNDFIELYNNNYRSIYHLEKIILNIITTIHEL